MITTIQLDKKTKEKLDLLKVHSRESYNELISRIIKNASQSNSSPNFDRESLIETIEVLSDPDMMRGIAEALKEEGGTSLEEFEKEL